MPHNWKYSHHSAEWDDGPTYYKCDQCGYTTSVSWPWEPPSPNKTIKWNKGKDPMTCEQITIARVESQ